MVTKVVNNDSDSKKFISSNMSTASLSNCKCNKQTKRAGSYLWGQYEIVDATASDVYIALRQVRHVIVYAHNTRLSDAHTYKHRQ